MSDMEGTNPATRLVLSTYADNEFARWVDWANKFGHMLENSQLTEGQKRIVRHVMCLVEERTI